LFSLDVLEVCFVGLSFGARVLRGRWRTRSSLEVVGLDGRWFLWLGTARGAGGFICCKRRCEGCSSSSCGSLMPRKSNRPCTPTVEDGLETRDWVVKTAE
jgi:hypothetical protein